jgi:hypothetical protein
MPSQTPEEMFADKSYDGWEELSPRQKVERMFSIHKSGHEEGEDVSFTVSISVFYVQPSVRERHNYPVCGYEYRSREATKPLFFYTCFPNPSRQNQYNCKVFMFLEYVETNLLLLLFFSASVQTSTKASTSSPLAHQHPQPPS